MTPGTAAAIRALQLPLIALAALLAVAAVTWADLEAGERAALMGVLTAPRIALIALLAGSALALLGWRQYRAAAEAAVRELRMAEALRLIAGPNPAHRLAPEGSGAQRALAEGINELAGQRARLLADVKASIAEAKARVEEEKERFAALVSELDQSVLVCNRDGRILLYNAAVAALFGAPGRGDAAPGLGLGRSVFGLIDRALILHAVEAVEAQSARGEREGAHFVTATADGRSLRVQLAPVFGRGAAR